MGAVHQMHRLCLWHQRGSREQPMLRKPYSSSRPAARLLMRSCRFPQRAIFSCLCRNIPQKFLIQPLITQSDDICHQNPHADSFNRVFSLSLAARSSSQTGKSSAGSPHAAAPQSAPQYRIAESAPYWQAFPFNVCAHSNARPISPAQRLRQKFKILIPAAVCRRLRYSSCRR